MAEGRIEDDGPTGEIKGMVGTRTIRLTLPGAQAPDLLGLDGVADVVIRGDSVTLMCTDSDAALRALLDRYAEARDIEVTGAGLEQAFLQLTATA
jgi:ABC-2 type transport system ATP-binding protein